MTARRPLRVNGKPIPRDIADGAPGDFARFCGETDPAVLANLDAEEEDDSAPSLDLPHKQGGVS